MKQEDKELLLKDLCARLPYGVKCGVLTHPNCRLPNLKKEDDLYYKGRPKYQTLDLATLSINPIECFIPYLRPMSSMTKEEKEKYESLCEWCLDDTGQNFHYDTVESFDYLNSIHVDYRGLIKKGLALEAPADMYNN